jgi:hypothetical protein
VVTDGVLQREGAGGAVALIRAFDDAIANHFGEAQRRPFPTGKDAHTAAGWSAKTIRRWLPMESANKRPPMVGDAPPRPIRAAVVMPSVLQSKS